MDHQAQSNASSAESEPITRQSTSETRQLSDSTIGPLWLVGIALWVGAVAGLIELLILVTVPNRAGPMWNMFGKSRHYPWMIPTTNALVILLAILPLAALGIFNRRAAGRIGIFLIVTLGTMAVLLAAFTNFYPLALVLLSMGIASRVEPLSRRWGRFRSLVLKFSAPLLVVALLILGWWTLGRGRWPGRGEPVGETPPNTPNVVLVVLDTVRADALNLYGSSRETMPNLTRFSQSGLVYDQARSVAPWTLTSHASFFTGRWPGELSAGRYRALDASYPTLAEVLAARGFETAGFVGNTIYCSYYTGLDRGFGTYVDIPATPLRMLVTTELGSHLVDNADWLHRRIQPSPTPESFKKLKPTAAQVNNSVFRWLDRRADTNRPFFVFINYFDAHDPYLLPHEADDPFEGRPESPQELTLLRNWWNWPGKLNLPFELRDLVFDAYSSCLFYLDQELNRLLRHLEQLGELENTIVIVTADHGELFGENGLYGHGISLSEPELHVPLIIVPPKSAGTQRQRGRIEEPVSLRDLPATILDLVGVQAPEIPGESLVRELLGQDRFKRSPSLSTLRAPSLFQPNNLPLRSPVTQGPMSSLVDDRLYKYIRIEQKKAGGFDEQLYRISSDPLEENDLGGAFAMQENLGRLREATTKLNESWSDSSQRSLRD